MTRVLFTIGQQLRCRCGQIGTVTGIEGSPDTPDTIWIRHQVRLASETHIHRAAQMRNLLLQQR